MSPPTGAAGKALRDLFNRHHVLVFRNQGLTPAQQLAFAETIGEPDTYPFVDGIEGFPTITPVLKLPDERVNFGGIWHSDTVYLEKPPMATLLLARELPPVGGVARSSPWISAPMAGDSGSTSQGRAAALVSVMGQTVVPVRRLRQGADNGPWPLPLERSGAMLHPCAYSIGGVLPFGMQAFCSGTGRGMSWELTLLPPEIGPVLFLGLIGASFVSSFLTVAFGIGGGALLLAVLAALMPPAALIPVHGVVQLGSNASRMLLLRRFVSWPALPGFVAGSLVGCALGGMIVVDLPPRFVQAGVGVFIIWTVLARPPQWLRRWPVLTGGLSSFLTMFFGATGLFVAGYTKSLKLERHGHVATHASLMTVQHLLKVIVFGVLGFAFGPWLAVIAGMILSGIAGTMAGRTMLSRMSDLNFRRALDVILVLISLRLIWAGIFSG